MIAKYVAKNKLKLHIGKKFYMVEIHKCPCRWGHDDVLSYEKKPKSKKFIKAG